jgi:hypothetical protein
MDVTVPLLSVMQNGSIWTFTVAWYETFSAEDIRRGLVFERKVEFWELDQPYSKNDFLGRVGLSAIKPAARSYPRWIQWSSSQVNTELGGEEIAAFVMYRLSWQPAQNWSWRQSNQVDINP